MTLPCIGEEIERQVGVMVGAGWLRGALCLDAGGLCGGLAVGGEGRVLCLLVSPVVV